MPINSTATEMLSAVSTIADVQWDSDRSLGVIVGIAPDSGGADTGPGSPWRDETDRILADVRSALPSGWYAGWEDDDIHISAASPLLAARAQEDQS